MAVGFAREIVVGSQPLTILALAGVSSAPDRRGVGLGAAVVRDQFTRVQTGEFPCSLFPTGPEVVEFYDRGGNQNPNLDSELHPLQFAAREKQALIAFLRSLSGQVQEGM